MPSSPAGRIHGFYKRSYANKLKTYYLNIQPLSGFLNNIITVESDIGTKANVIHVKANKEIWMKINHDRDAVIKIETNEEFTMDFMEVFQLEFKSRQVSIVDIRIIVGGLLDK